MSLLTLLVLLVFVLLIGIVLGAKFHAFFVEDAKATLSAAQAARDEANKLFDRAEEALSAKHTINNLAQVAQAHSKAPPPAPKT